MTEKGLEYQCSVKEQLARAANKLFHVRLNTFHSFLVGTRDHKQINAQFKELEALAKNTRQKLTDWFELVKNTPQAALITDLLGAIESSVEGARSAALKRLLH